MKQGVFTIVAKNYIGLAQILEKSVRAHAPAASFYIFVADQFDTIPDRLPDNIIIAKDSLDYTEEQWTDMAFKYDLTEFCTSIKPDCFRLMFEQGYDQVVYFDPDIYVFSSLSPIFTALDAHDVVLTPQVAGLHVDYTGEHPEWAMNVNGIFNLGFCGMRRGQVSKRVVAWWKKRLIDNAFADRSVGNFTDQKWMDWLPGMLTQQQLGVLHELGMNMAPWNFFERQLYTDDGVVKVKYRTDDNTQRSDRLVFFHFAGYDYQKLKEGVVERKRIENLKDYDDLRLATDCYRDQIQQHRDVFDRYIAQPYTYNSYDNGDSIAVFHRRLYHGLRSLRQESPGNPFATGKGTFHDSIRRRGMIVAELPDRINKNNLAGMDRKRAMIGRLFDGLYRLMGFKRYVLFVKSLYNYCRPEWHTFLIKK